MQEKDSKKSNPRKLRLIPRSDIWKIIASTHDAIKKLGKRPKTADTILMLAHAYVDLLGAYKNVKKELTALKAPRVLRVKHSSQAWRPAKSNKDKELKEEELKNKLRDAGDAGVEAILRLIGE